MSILLIKILSFKSSAMKRNFTIVFMGVCILLTLLTGLVQAAFLRNVPVTITQPDGSVLTVLATGDEYYYRIHDQNNFTITRDPVTGYYVYATLMGGELSPTQYIVGQSDPSAAGLQPEVNITPEKWKQLRDDFWENTPGKAVLNPSVLLNSLTTGTLNNLVVYIRFNDQADFTQDLNYYDGLFNNNSPGANSMIHYYEEVSYGTLTIPTHYFPNPSGTTMLSYQDYHDRDYFMPYDAVTNPNGYDGQNQRAEREHALLADAVSNISSQVPTSLDIDHDNDGYVDNICFIVRGGTTDWSTLLWPHRWVLSNEMAYINGKQVWDYNFQLDDFLAGSGNGVLCHEMFHTLGAPDLYHYTSDGISPMGPWDLMDNDNNPPQHMCAWMKYKYAGWISSIPVISGTGTFTLNPLTSPTGNCYKIPSPGSVDEFVIVEYRKQTGTFESTLPGSGIIIYRIDASAGNGNANGPPDEVYLFRPYGSLTSNGDIYQAFYSTDVGRTVFNNMTNPYGFMQDGSPLNISISNIGSAGNTISFYVTQDTSQGNWTLQNTGFTSVNRGIRYISAVNDQVLWAHAFDVSNAGNSLLEFTRTSDGGSVWSPVTVTGYSGYGASMIYAQSYDTAWIPVFSSSGGGAILRTVDGGLTWNPQPTALFSAPAGFPNIIHFWNPNEGMCMGDPNGGYFEIYTTNNGGTDWVRVPQTDIPANLTEEYGIIGCYDVVGQTVWFTTNKGRVFKSDDLGHHWQASQTPLPSWCDVKFEDLNHGLLFDKDQDNTMVFYETFDGGMSWYSPTSNGPVYNYMIDWVPGTTNTCVSTGVNASGSGCSYSIDGGHNWMPFPGTAGSTLYYTLWTNNTNGWAGTFTTNTSPGSGGGMYKFSGTFPGNMYDVAIQAVTQPVTGSNLGNAETLTLELKNNGNTPITNIPVSWTVNGGVEQSTFITSVVINPGQVATVTVSNSLDLSYLGLYYIKVYTSLPSDINSNNDTLTITVQNLNQGIGEWVLRNTNFPNTATGILYLSARDSLVLWATGYDGSGAGATYQVYTRSQDGGDTWTAGSIPGYTGYGTSMVFALSYDTAWIPLYGPSGGGVLLKTTDGGANWNPQPTAAFSAPVGFPNIVHFWNASEGMCMGDPNGGYFEIYTTTNGGDTWNRVPQADIPAHYSGEYGTTGYYDVVGDIVYFSTNKGRVFKSTDKGYHWTAYQTGYFSSYFSIRFLDENHGIGFAKDPNDYYRIIKTYDGGASWSPIYPSGTMMEGDFSWVPGTIASCITTGYSGNNTGCSYSTDEGQSWTPFNETLGTQFLVTRWTDPHHGWAGSFNTINGSQNTGGMWKYIGSVPSDTFDIGVVSILAPTTGSGLTSSESVSITVANYGNYIVHSAPVMYTLDGNTWNISYLPDPLYPGSVDTFTFQQPADLSAEGCYQITAFTDLPNDINRFNDTVVKTVVHLPPLALSSVIGITRYDLQTNYSTQNRIYQHEDGTIGTSWTYGMLNSSFSDRGTGYNYFDGTNWKPYPSSRIETVKTGWPSYAPYGPNGEIVASHQSNLSSILLSYRTNKGSGTWSTFSTPAPSNHKLTWPRMVTNGPDHSTVHVISVTSPVANGGNLYNNQDGALIYNRSENGGYTWSQFDVNLPQTGIAYYNGLGGDKYAFAESRGDTLAFVYGDNWTDIFLLKSTDNGDTWTKSLIFQHPYPHFSESQTLVTDTPYVCDGSISAAIDLQGKVHVVFGLQRVNNDDINDGTTTYFPITDGLVYWNEDMPMFTTLNYNDLQNNGQLVGRTPDKNNNGVFDYVGVGTYFNSLTSMPTLSVDDNNRMLLVMSTVYEDHDNGSQNYRQLVARSSLDNGQNWSELFELTGNDQAYQYTECVYPSMSPTSDDYFHLIFQADEEPGIAVSGDLDPYTENNIVYLKIPKTVVAPINVGITEIPAPSSGPALSDFESITVKVRNFSEQTVYNIPVWYSIDNGAQVKEIIPGALAGGGEMLYTFNQNCNLAEPGHIYLITASTALTGDPMTPDNMTSKQVTNTFSGTPVQVSLQAMDVCSGLVTVPVTVTNMSEVTYFRITLSIDTNQLSLDSYLNFNPALNQADWQVTTLGQQVQITCTLPSPVNILSGNLIDLVFIVDAGISTLNWLTGLPGLCRFETLNGQFIPSIYLNGSLTAVNCSNLDGFLTYDNATSTPLTNTTVRILQNGIVNKETPTNAQGYYYISEVNPGIYTTGGSSTKPWGGANAADGLAILQHFTGMITLTSLRKQAADVDATGFVNAADALMIARRFVGQINSFPSGNWLFSKDTVEIPYNTTVSHSFRGICFGDANGSFLPTLKTEPGVEIMEEGVLQLSAGNTFRLPFRLLHPERLGALSLVLDYPSEILDISNIYSDLPEFNQGICVYHITQGQVRLAWFSLIPMSLQKNDILFSLEGRVREQADYTATFPAITASVECEANDLQGSPLKKITLFVPRILMVPQGEPHLDLYPNPADGSTFLQYSLPADGIVEIRLLDAGGREVFPVISGNQQQGCGMQVLRTDQLDPGLYTLYARFITRDSATIRVKKLLVIH